MKLRAFIVFFLISSVALAGGDKVHEPILHVPSITLDYTPPPLLANPPGDDHIVSVEKGERAPFDGQLFDPNTALRWAHYLQQAKLRLKQDVVKERKICKANILFMKRVVELERGYHDDIEEDLRTRVVKLEQEKRDLVAEMNDPSFFSSPGFWFALGVLTTGLLVGAGAIVGSQIGR